MTRTFSTSSQLFRFIFRRKVGEKFSSLLILTWDGNGAVLASLFPSPAVMSNSALASPLLSDPRNFSPFCFAEAFGRLWDVNEGGGESFNLGNLCFLAFLIYE
jgi:hypothetical protein